MIILTKSFKRQLDKVKVELSDVISSVNRVLTKKILRKGDAILPNSFIKLKNCIVYKIRVGKKQQARMLIVFIIVNNIKIPFLIVQKNDKKLGQNLSINSFKKLIKYNVDKSLSEFDNNEFDEIDEGKFQVI